MMAEACTGSADARASDDWRAALFWPKRLRATSDVVVVAVVVVVVVVVVMVVVVMVVVVVIVMVVVVGEPAR